jgi:hypothetical protein
LIGDQPEIALTHDLTPEAEGTPHLVAIVPSNEAKTLPGK